MIGAFAPRERAGAARSPLDPRAPDRTRNRSRPDGCRSPNAALLLETARHGGDAMVRKVYGRSAQVRHRAAAVEYRVEQYAAKLGERLAAVRGATLARPYA